MAPAKRQRTTAPAQQSTLSFSRSKPSTTRSTNDKVSKPGDAAKAKTSLEKTDQSLEKPLQKPDSVEEIVLERAEPEAVDEETVEEEEDEDEIAAQKVGEKQLKAYWAAKDKERKAPRVHQENLGLYEKILREFDMQTRYGPSIGIKRLPRWRRARGLGFDPPIEVLAVLLKHDRAQTSIMDELILSSRLTGDVSAS